MSNKKSRACDLYENYLNLLTHEDRMNADDVKGITVRLGRWDRARLDTLASLAGVSRQQLAVDLLLAAAAEAEDAFLQYEGVDGFDGQHKIFDERHSEIYQKMKAAEAESK